MLLERGKRAETVLITAVPDCYLAGVSTRRKDKLVKLPGHLLPVQVPGHEMVAEHVEQLPPPPPLDAAGPFSSVAADALTMKGLEGGRVITAMVLIATGLNGDGHREVLGLRVGTDAVVIFPDVTRSFASWARS